MDALENSVAISYEPIWQQTLSLNLAYDIVSPTLWLLTLNELPANAQCSQETYLGNSEVLSTTMAHVSPRHFLSPKLFYFYLPCAQSWLFQLSHNNILISLLVPFSAPTSTGSQTNIYNDLATMFTKLFPQWLKVLLKFTSYRSLSFWKRLGF